MTVTANASAGDELRPDLIRFLADAQWYAQRLTSLVTSTCHGEANVSAWPRSFQTRLAHLEHTCRHPFRRVQSHAFVVLELLKDWSALSVFPLTKLSFLHQNDTKGPDIVGSGSVTREWLRVWLLAFCKIVSTIYDHLHQATYQVTCRMLSHIQSLR
jgi:hypothetical protein